MKKIISIICCLSLILTVFTCCNKKDPDAPMQTVAQTDQPLTGQTKKTEERQISLSYNSKQPFNPFQTESTINKNIASLLYDSLFRLDSGYNALPLLAKAYSLDGKKLTVSLKDSLFFSDGSPVTANDVIVSYKNAKSSPVYASRLEGFSSAAAGNDSLSIVFMLKQENIYAVNCLDFPVVKAGTVSQSIPVGSGRYTLKKISGAYTLEANAQNTRNEELEQSKIYLRPADAEGGELAGLQIGDISFIFDNMSQTAEKKQISAGTMDIPLNILVFLGFNNNAELFQDMNLKKAVEAAIDVNAICTTAYNSLAKPCATVFNPDWSEASALSAEPPKPQTALSQQLLEESGYIYAYENNEYRSKDFEFLEMTLIVNNDSEPKLKAAQLIASALKSVGIDVKVDELAFDEYKSRLSKGDFDLYLGEIKLTSDMSFSPFFSQEGGASFSIDTESTAAKAYADLAAGKIDVSTFCKVFDEYKPFLPLGYRYGIAYYSRELKYEGAVSENDIFANIYSWSFS